MLTRRSFLQLVGATVAAATLSPLTRLTAAVNTDVYQGRALTALPVYVKPGITQPVVGRLWPDSITSIIDQQSEWYRIPEGWVQREGLQPMLVYDPQDYVFSQAAPFWAEVAAPAVSIRTYCAADAPLVTRVGHGGVLKVIDTLPGEPNGWYGVANEHGDLLGWTQGVFWRPVTFDDDSRSKRTLYFNQQDFLMTAYQGDEVVLQAPFSSGDGLAAGSFQPLRGLVSGRVAGYYGVPWQTMFGEGQTIAGVYWHNQFGRSVTNGSAVQITPLLARWVYGWAGEDAHIVVE